MGKHNHYEGIILQKNCKECERIKQWQIKYLSFPFIIFIILLMIAIIKNKLWG